jgi:hypothetical protein
MPELPELLRNLLLIVVGWVLLSLPLALALGRIIGASGDAPTPRPRRGEEDDGLAA